MVRNKINLAKFTNAHPVYSDSFIKMDKGKSLELVIPDSLCLETLLCQLRGEIIKFSKKLAGSERELENKLKREILLLEKKTVNFPLSEEDLKSLE